VPSDDGLVIFPWATRNAFVVIKESLLVVDCIKFLSRLLVALHGEVDVTDLVVALRDKVNASNLGDDGKSIRTVPSVVRERRIPCSDQL
jgi:hypothetical protein